MFFFLLSVVLSLSTELFCFILQPHKVSFSLKYGRMVLIFSLGNLNYLQGREDANNNIKYL